MASGHEPSKLSGNVKEAKGAVRENLGKAIGSDEQQMKGASKRAEGQTEHQAAEAKGWLEGAADKVTGTVKENAGWAIGNKQMESEGKAQATKGDAKKAANE